MKKIIILSIFSFFVLFSCEKEDDDYKNVSSCIKSKIKSFSNSNQICDNANVKEYMFQSEKAYVFNPGNCYADGGSEVYDENCNYLGYLGGFTGNMKINNVNFHDEAVFLRTVWGK